MKNNNKVIRKYFSTRACRVLILCYNSYVKGGLCLCKWNKCLIMKMIKMSFKNSEETLTRKSKKERLTPLLVEMKKLERLSKY